MLIPAGFFCFCFWLRRIIQVLPHRVSLCTSDLRLSCLQPWIPSVRNTNLRFIPTDAHSSGDCAWSANPLVICSVLCSGKFLSCQRQSKRSISRLARASVGCLGQGSFVHSWEISWIFTGAANSTLSPEEKLRGLLTGLEFTYIVVSAGFPGSWRRDPKLSSEDEAPSYPDFHNPIGCRTRFVY